MGRSDKFPRGHPTTAMFLDIVDDLQQMITLDDHQITYDVIKESLKISSTGVHPILHGNLKLIIEKGSIHFDGS